MSETSAEELSDIISMEIDKIEKAIQWEAHVSSIDAPVTDDETSTMADTLASSADYASDKQVDYESMCSDLMMVLRSVLNERERIIVVQSFGIGCVIKCHLDRARALLARYRRDARTE